MEKLEKNEDGDYILENGEDIGCIHCEVHRRAYAKFKKMQPTKRSHLIDPVCPKCGNVVECDYASGYDYAVVSEANFYVPEGQIGYYKIYHCEECEQTYAMMPIPIVYNANHDTFYTGGRQYAEDDEVKKLCSSVAGKLMPLINDYIERRENPEHPLDKCLTIDNVDGWCTGDIEHLICNWLYEKGYKK